MSVLPTQRMLNEKYEYFYEIYSSQQNTCARYSAVSRAHENWDDFAVGCFSDPRQLACGTDERKMGAHMLTEY